MVRGFVTGVLWGGLVAAAGLVVVSQVAPPPKGAEVVALAPAAEPVPEFEAAPGVETGVEAAPSAEPAPDDLALNDPVLSDPVIPDPAPADPVPPDPAPAEPAPADSLRPATPLQDPPAVAQSPLTEAAPAAPGTDTALAADAAAPQPAPPADEPAPGALADPNPLPGAAADALLEPAAPVPDDAAPDEAAPAAPLPEGPAQAGDAPPAPAEPAAETVPAADGTVAPAVEPAPPAPEVPAPEVPAPADTAPAAPDQNAAPRLLIDDRPATLPSAGTIGNRAKGVTTGRLPSIGAAPAEAAPAAPAAEDLPPLQRFARVFGGAEGKPLFVILLRDIGAAGMARDSLTTLPFPVTFVVDPAAPDAAEAEAAYRAAGQEVLMLATGIPPGAQPSDLEQTFQSLAATLPQAVGVVDLSEGGFQDNRDLASQVVPILKEQGRGLVTYDQGLNAADQVARREGVAATTIFRRLDADGEAVPVVRRYLDRAAFRAAQEGQVVVIGDTRAETVAAIMEWTLEGRAAAVTLAPVTAVLGLE